ncbi:unnamed protein product [Urochloa humidicola]
MDRYGRRLLLVIGGALMCHVIMASIIGSQLGNNGSKMAKGYAVAVLIATFLFSVSFSWSWGALYWAIPGDIYPVQGATVAINLGLNFLQAQFFMEMLCCFRYGMFLFYASWLVSMTAFSVALVLECS